MGRNQSNVTGSGNGDIPEEYSYKADIQPQGSAVKVAAVRAHVPEVRNGVSGASTEPVSSSATVSCWASASPSGVDHSAITGPQPESTQGTK